MEIIKNGCIKNWSPGFGQTCQAWNRLRLEGYGIEVTPVCPGTGRNFDNRVTNFDNRVTGRPVITQRIYYGQNSVDMSGLAAGMYVWKVLDGEHEIKEGKVVKM